MTEYLDIKKAAKLLGCSGGYVRWLCIKDKLPGAKKTGSRWKIPLTAHPKLAGADQRVDMLPSSVPVNKREEAIRRLGIIRSFEKFAALNGHTRTEAIEIFVAGHDDIKKRTLERWLARHRDRGILGLVDNRGGKFISETISPEAFELFKSMYLSQQRLSVKGCWQNMSFVNRNESKGWKIPHLQAMYRIINEQIPLPVQVLHREGLSAYEARCAPYIQVDPNSVQPGQVWVGDHSQFNCWIRHRGKWIRPWVTAWQDMRSRAIVGWHISASPNQTTILLGMKRAIEKHGPPDSVKVDNGKDYDSECWTGTTKAKRRALKAGYIDEQMVAGIYAMIGIGVSFSIKYHPQSKPIERFFDTLDCQFTKTIRTYCGKDTERKPDYLNGLLSSDKAQREAYDLGQLTELVGRYIKVYNHTAHSGRGMEGSSPAQVLSQRSSRRLLAEGVLDLLMRVWSGELVVGKNGVRFKGIYYGQYNTDLVMHQGKKVRVAYDPDDLRSLYVYDAVTLKLITIAEQNQLIRYGEPVGEENLREAMHRKSRAVKAAREFRDSRLTANMDLTDLTIRAMQEASEKPQEQPAAKTLRPVRTPLDNQVAEHKRLKTVKTVKAVKKAAGAESIETVLDMDLTVLTHRQRSEPIDIDLNQLKPKQNTVDLELFKNG